MAKKSVNLDDYLVHFPPEIYPEIKEYATNKALEHSRYIFTTRRGKHKYGYCTHCHANFEMFGTARRIKKPDTSQACHLAYVLPDDIQEKRGLDTMICPRCGSKCIIKASGRKRTQLIDQAYFVYYEKSVINPQIIIARGFLAVRDYRGSYTNVKTQLIDRALYIFEMGNPVMFHRAGHYSTYMYGRFLADNGFVTGKWEPSSSVHSLYPGRWGENLSGQRHVFDMCIPVFLADDSVDTAVENTPFRYSQYDEYMCFNQSDMVKFFALYCKYPCIEYFTKLGMNSLVEAKIKGQRTYSAVNWKGKSLFSILRITKQDLKEIQARQILVTFMFLRLIQDFRRAGENLSLSEISDIEQAGYYYEDYYSTIFKAALEYAPIRKVHNYFKKQEQRAERTFRGVLTTWRDYIEDCKKLNWDLSQETVVFPRDLHQAHQNSIKQVRLKADKELDKKIRTLAKKLEKRYCFQHNGLLIRPAADTAELINEGKSLHHCVGTYASYYASGNSILLVIRKISDPDTPYFTMEINRQGNSIVQCRGLKNRDYAGDSFVKEFVEAFKAAKLPKKQQVRVLVPA